MPRSQERHKTKCSNVLGCIETRAVTAPCVRSRNPVFRIRTLHQTGDQSLRSAPALDPPCTASTAVHTFGRRQFGLPDRPSIPFVGSKV